MRIFVMALGGLSLLSACAKTPAGYAAAERDPWEGLNRDIYSFNDAVDKAVLKPAAQGYRAVVPAPARTGISNAFANTDEPLSFINAILQGKPKRAFRAVDRFVVNSTVGFLGFDDPATRWGLERQNEDFGQTFAVWGIGSGPFVMLPVLGPSSVRDAVGTGIGFALNPFTIFENDVLNLSFTEQAALQAGEVIDLRAGLIDTVDPILENALDPYSTQKSAYIQARTAQINNGAQPADGGAFEEMEEFEEFEFDDEPADAAAPEAPSGVPDEGAAETPSDPDADAATETPAGDPEKSLDAEPDTPPTDAPRTRS